MLVNSVIQEVNRAVLQWSAGVCRSRQLKTVVVLI